MTLSPLPVGLKVHLRGCGAVVALHRVGPRVFLGTRGVASWPGSLLSIAARKIRLMRGSILESSEVAGILYFMQRAE